MDPVAIVEWLGDAPAMLLASLVSGMVFGIAAQRSRFCLRAAAVEFAHGRPAQRFAVWLLCFSTALVWVQGAALLGAFDPGESRMLAVTGSWSGAVIGGLMFGAGMILARGCSGRLLVLAATGNLRAVVSGLVFAVVAQMSGRGLLAPLRDRLAALWVTEGGHNLELLAGWPTGTGLVIGLGFALLALWLSWQARISVATLLFGSGVGFAVAVGYVLTWELAQVSFTPVTVKSLTFTGPSADMLMYVLEQGWLADFDIGLIAGVFLGALIAALSDGSSPSRDSRTPTT